MVTSSCFNWMNMMNYQCINIDDLSTGLDPQCWLTCHLCWIPSVWWPKHTCCVQALLTWEIKVSKLTSRFQEFIKVTDRLMYVNCPLCVCFFMFHVLWYCHLTLTVYNSKMLLLNMRRDYSSDQKVFKRLVLPVGDNWWFRIYLTESVALSYKVPMFHKNLF